MDPEHWTALYQSLPPFSFCVAVFGPEDTEQAQEILALGGFSACQVHGANPKLPPVPPGVLLYRAFDPSQDDLSDAQQFAQAATHHRILLDPRVEGKDGGTGVLAQGEAVDRWLKAFPQAVLAGGLNAQNVAASVARHRPRAVDASSGLEKSPGLKDPEKVRLYISQAKGSM